MRLRAGQTLVSTVDATAVVVIRACAEGSRAPRPLPAAD